MLVHDAARPNLARSDLDKLLHSLADDPVGGLLAVPAQDTLKRAGADGRVCATVDRSVIWQAYTPQMFRLGEHYARHWPKHWRRGWRLPMRHRPWSGPDRRRGLSKGVPTTSR